LNKFNIFIKKATQNLGQKTKKHVACYVKLANYTLRINLF